MPQFRLTAVEIASDLTGNARRRVELRTIRRRS